ncbi:hypothetical protein TNCV_2814571 [Trichonephila clavipes]|nr:hypothetical protein TNCV_2814571 [Trichonephila clavipes]
MAAARRSVGSTSFWKRSTGMTCRILDKAVHKAVRWPIYDRKVSGMLIQSASNEPGLVRGTVVLLENSLTMRTTEQNKRMEVFTQQLYVPKYVEGGWYMH